MPGDYRVRNFMQQHSAGLKALTSMNYSDKHTLSPDNLSQHNHALFDHNFPNLESLTLSSHVARHEILDNSLAMRYSKRPRSKLCSLALKGLILSHDNVTQHLFSADALHGVFSNLTRLTFSVLCLDVTLLSFLADALSQLEYLSITLYRDIRGPKYEGNERNPTQSPPVDTTEFRTTLASLNSTQLTIFSTWKLRGLDLVPYFCNTQLDPPARKTLVAVLPNVQSFCNLGRREYTNADTDPGEEWSRQLNYFDMEQVV
ncbi:hypothetical protein CVT24_012520 [Panaeolus cyanescens]|uniref:Uncharacterized protein n=1 Tax=Panaeolus cyanescens TaxID=181874 RepID=A0A409YK59_9AGAR|nr:hypothetical protein CVT24_012520 [Panaeolus cyanescens]